MQVRRQSIDGDRFGDRVYADDSEVLGVGRNWRKIRITVAVIARASARRKLLPVDDIGRRTGGTPAVINLVRHLARTLRQVQADACAIALRLARRLIVHVEVDVGTGLDALTRAGQIRLVATSGNKRQQLVVLL